MSHNNECGCNRRQFLRSAVAGSILMPGLLSQLLAGEDKTNESDPLAPKATHFPPKAKRVIFLFMTGGVSHVESFDPKPKLFADHNKTYAVNEFQGKPGKYNMYVKNRSGRTSRAENVALKSATCFQTFAIAPTIFA